MKNYSPKLFKLSLKNIQTAIGLMPIALCVCLSACDNKSNHDSQKDTIATVIPKQETIKPSWGPTITDTMLMVVDKLSSMNAVPTATLSAEEARKQFTPAGAVMKIIKEKNIKIPISNVDTTGKMIAINRTKIPIRIYTPKGHKGKLPIIVYYHGGGWVLANLDTYDASARALCEKTNTVLVSVAYRQGPEFKFPTAHDDAYAAYKWVHKNATSINGDNTKMAVAGESAGGNLAINVSIKARDEKFHVPFYQLLIYPVANNDTASASYVKYHDAKPLNKPLMDWFVKKYLTTPNETNDMRISVLKANLKNLPPTTIITAEIDPLQSEGELLHQALKKAGVNSDYKEYKGVVHEFFGMSAIIAEARDAQKFSAKEFKKYLDK